MKIMVDVFVEIVVKVITMLVHVFSGGYALGNSFFFHKIRKDLLDFLGLLYILYLKDGSGLVGGVADDGTKTEDTLSEGSFKSHVKDPVKPYLLLLSVKETGIYKELVLV
jgi:hypothetical protein